MAPARRQPAQTLVRANPSEQRRFVTKVFNEPKTSRIYYSSLSVPQRERTNEEEEQQHPVRNESGTVAREGHTEPPCQQGALLAGEHSRNPDEDSDVFASLWIRKDQSYSSTCWPTVALLHKHLEPGSAPSLPLTGSHTTPGGLSATRQEAA